MRRKSEGEAHQTNGNHAAELYTISTRRAFTMSYGIHELRQIRGVLFDLDGTLLDSFSSHYEAYERTFARFGIQMSREKFLSSYSPDWYQTYEAMGLPRETWAAANDYWLEEAAKRDPDLLPGVKETLAELCKGYALGLVTSGSRSRVTRDLERTGLGPLFRIVVTGDDVQRPKPSPDGLVMALGELAMDPGEAVYIGDALADYEMARAADVGFLCVVSEFTASHSDHSFTRMQSISDLLGLLKSV